MFLGAVAATPGQQTTSPTEQYWGTSDQYTNSGNNLQSTGKGEREKRVLHNYTDFSYLRNFERCKLLFCSFAKYNSLFRCMHNVYYMYCMMYKVYYMYCIMYCIMYNTDIHCICGG